MNEQQRIIAFLTDDARRLRADPDPDLYGAFISRYVDWLAIRIERGEHEAYPIERDRAEREYRARELDERPVQSPEPI